MFVRRPICWNCSCTILNSSNSYWLTEQQQSIFSTSQCLLSCYDAGIILKTAMTRYHPEAIEYKQCLVDIVSIHESSRLPAWVDCQLSELWVGEMPVPVQIVLLHPWVHDWMRMSPGQQACYYMRFPQVSNVANSIWKTSGKLGTGDRFFCVSLVIKSPLSRSLETLCSACMAPDE